MRGSFSLLGTFTCAVLLAAAAPAGAAAPPAFYDFTPAGLRSFGAAVNDAGQVAGTGAAGAFRYDLTPGGGGVIHFLGSFGDDSIGMGINNVGQVVGYSTFTGGFVTHAFRYDGTPGSDGVMYDLGELSRSGGSSLGFAVNDAGQVAGFTNITGPIPSSVYHAFRHDAVMMHDLSTLGGTSSYGRGINNAGQIAGYSQTTGNTAEHAFRYDGAPGAGGVMRDLGTLGGMTSYGVGINDAGQVTGNSFITGSTIRHAFRYDGTPGSGGVMRDLGTFGGTSSFGSGINDAGQVVGTSDLAGDAAMHAFLYTGTPGAGGQMIDLDDWLDANIPNEGAKWKLAGLGAGPSDISNTGWITGTGIYDPDGPGGVADDFRAYLLDASALVPEPTGLALLVLGGPPILRRSRRGLIGGGATG